MDDDEFNEEGEGEEILNENETNNNNNENEKIKLDGERLEEEYFHFVKSGDLVHLKKLVSEHSLNVRKLKERDHPKSYGIHVACTGGHIALVKFFLKKGCRELVDRDGWNCVLYAAESGKLEVMKFLVDDEEFDVNFLSEDKNTALHRAAYGGHFHVVKYLVSKKANLEVKNAEGDTPLSLSKEEGVPVEIHTFLKENIECFHEKNDMSVEDFIRMKEREKEHKEEIRKLKKELQRVKNNSGRINIGSFFGTNDDEEANEFDEDIKEEEEITIRYEPIKENIKGSRESRVEYFESKDDDVEDAWYVGLCIIS